MGAGATQIEAERSSLIPVSPETLRADSVPSVDLYLERRVADTEDGRRYVLYRRGTQTITSHHLEALADNGVSTLFIKTDEQDAYRRYIETHLDELLADETTAPAKKAEAVFEAATGLVKDVLRDPTSPESMARTQRLVAGTITFLSGDEDALRNLISTMAADYTTYTHSVDVCVYSISLANRLGVDRSVLNELALGALLHDVGKTRVPREILHKKGSLTDEEYAIVKLHPQMGMDVLKQGRSLSDVVYEIVLSHHEKMDGSGYPHGLKGPDIHRFAKMTCIIDIFDALTTNRSYKRAMSFFDALNLMRVEMLDCLDRDLWKEFVLMLGQREQSPP